MNEHSVVVCELNATLRWFLTEIVSVIRCSCGFSPDFAPTASSVVEADDLRIRRKTLRFFGTWNRQFRSSECDPVIRLACAGFRTSMVLSKDATKARAFGRDRAEASVWGRVFLASIALPKDDSKRTGLVRRSDVPRLSVRKICLFDATPRR